MSEYEEFSPRKFILLVQGIGRFILSKWWIILSAGVLFALAGAAYTMTKKPQYIAEVTFVLDEEATQQPRSGISELSEELGLPADAGGVFSSPTNIMELMQSRLLVEKTLRSTVQVEGRTVLLANFFLDSLEYREKWLEKSPYKNVDFQAKNKSKEQVMFESGLIGRMCGTLNDKNIKIERKGKGTTIFSVQCISTHPLFSKFFLEELLNTVTQYYVEKKTERAKLNVDFIQKRTDSVRQAYNAALYGRAEFTDAFFNPNRQTPLVSREKQQTDIQILRTSYVELTRSLEAAKTSLMRETPLIQYLDLPQLPLAVLRANMMKNALLAFLAGVFLTTAFLVIRKSLKVILSNRWG
jgi:uncharacterized protein involved in exopolysaccharide biosynthesis